MNFNSPGYPVRNTVANLRARAPYKDPICPRCHMPLKRIHRSYVDDDERTIQREVLWKCACTSGDPIPVILEPNREDFPVGG